jgi:thiopurine S-methyltransferase
METMADDYWIRKWLANDIRFHQSAAHPTLTREFGDLPPGRVLVPLCGKSLDLVWLRSRGHHVVGVELSPIACRDFFEENGIPFQRVASGTHEIYRGDGIELWCGDFFELPGHVLEGTTAIYDRAAIIALPPDMRTRYAQFLVRHLPAMSPTLEMLLITVEYAEGTISGPPFSVPEEEVRRHYSAAFPHLERLYCEADAELSSRNPAAGGAAVSETAYRMKRI